MLHTPRSAPFTLSTWPATAIPTFTDLDNQ
jgi:hypothetical protein